MVTSNRLITLSRLINVSKCLCNDHLIDNFLWLNNSHAPCRHKTAARIKRQPLTRIAVFCACAGWECPNLTGIAMSNFGSEWQI